MDKKLWENISLVYGTTWVRVNDENVSSRVNCSLIVAFIRMWRAFGINLTFPHSHEFFFFKWRSCNVQANVQRRSPCPDRDTGEHLLWFPANSALIAGGWHTCTGQISDLRETWLMETLQLFLCISAKARTRLYGSWNALINAPVAGLAACHLPRVQM